MHKAFDETVKAANKRGIRVTGSELVGLVPLKAMTDAADFFLLKQQRSLGISEAEKIKICKVVIRRSKPLIPMKESLNTL